MFDLYPSKEALDGAIARESGGMGETFDNSTSFAALGERGTVMKGPARPSIRLAQLGHHATTSWRSKCSSGASSARPNGAAIVFVVILARAGCRGQGA